MPRETVTHSRTRKRGDEDVRRVTDQGPCVVGRMLEMGKMACCHGPPNTARAASKGVPWAELCSPKTHLQKS